MIHPAGAGRRPASLAAASPLKSLAIPELEKTLEGELTGHHRFLLKMLWKELAQQEELIAELDSQIMGQTRPLA
jgi:hypothetical protein